MTIQVQAPKKCWNLRPNLKGTSGNTYFGYNFAQSAANVAPLHKRLYEPAAPPRRLREVSYNVKENRLVHSLPIARTSENTNTDVWRWDALPTGNTAIYHPENFALSEIYNFSNNAVNFLLRDGLTYWLTAAQTLRYLKGETLRISGTKVVIQVDDLPETPTLFDGFGEDFVIGGLVFESDPEPTFIPTGVRKTAATALPAPKARYNVSILTAVREKEVAA